MGGILRRTCLACCSTGSSFETLAKPPRLLERPRQPRLDYTTALSAEDAAYGMAETVNEKGFFIFPSDLFGNVRSRARRDPNLNETLGKVFRNIEASAVVLPARMTSRACSTTWT